ncbi:sensor histidine kinase [Shewanella spartinae]|uniref:sensor histidine kinase n=1 Tax=Shewanella spartinae TaxID=2864205 RepID=UPI001C65C380|nr:sensor histidine kinase [Shewanella spartinae]QYJ93475.1 sensor histidine kinase [Shewanella spartinae]
MDKYPIPHTLDIERATEDKLAWVYLINLGFYFIPLFLQTMPTWHIVVSLLVLVPFIYCYFWAHRSPSKTAYQPILLIIALACLITPVNIGSLSLFTFAGFFIGFNYSLPKAFASLIGLAVILTLLSLTLGIHYYFAVYGVALITGVGFFGVAERKRVEAKRAQRQSQQEIRQLATMLERERIARDLHDIMGHSLSSISLKAELARKLLAKGQADQASAELAELETIARDSLSQIRQTVSGYKHKGLDATLTHLCQMLRDKGMAVTLSGELPSQPQEVETQLILSLTELCNNVMRHSQGDSCNIDLSATPQRLRISVTDNGKLRQLCEGNGLTGIRERLRPLGGTLSIGLEPNPKFIIELPNQG